MQVENKLVDCCLEKDTMIAKGLLLFCLVGLSCATFLRKRQLAVAQPLQSLQTTPLLYRHEVPEVQEYYALPVVHKVHQPVHVEKYIQPVVHHIYRQPLLRTSVENPVIPQERVIQPIVPLVPENNVVNVQSQAQARAESQVTA